MMKHWKKDVAAMCTSRRVPLPAVYIELGAVGNTSEDVVIPITCFEEGFGLTQLIDAVSKVKVILCRRHDGCNLVVELSSKPLKGDIES